MLFDTAGDWCGILTLFLFDTAGDCSLADILLFIAGRGHVRGHDQQ
jgi:hypothetical protein